MSHPALRRTFIAVSAFLLAIFTAPASQFQNEFLRTEHGFSALVTVARGGRETRVLFDAGRDWQGGDAGRRDVVPYLAARGGLIVEPVRSTQLVNLSYRSTNPEFAARAVNGFAEAFIDLRTRTQRVPPSGQATRYSVSKSVHVVIDCSTVASVASRPFDCTPTLGMRLRSASR